MPTGSVPERDVSAHRPAMGKASVETAAHLAVRVVPRSSRTAVIGVRADRTVLVRVAAPPVDGAANAAVAKVLAEALGVRPGALRLLAGARGRDKRFAVDGLGGDAIARWIDALAVVGEEGKQDV